MRQRGHRAVAQGLVQWSGAAVDQATWEDLEALAQRFPGAPAWGQAGTQAGGIVSVPAPPASATVDQEGEPARQEQERPRRNRRGPRWMTDGRWVT
jgi:hypothetical protein